MDMNVFIERVIKEVQKRIESTLPKIMTIGRGKLVKEDLDKASIGYISYDNYEDDMIIDNYESIVIEGLTNFELVSSALLVPGTNVSKLILKGRLTGKTIYIEKESIEYKKYKSIIDKGLERKLEQYVDCLRDYGVKILKAQEIVEDIKAHNGNVNLNNETNVKSAYQSKDQCRLDKKLITEQDLKKLIQQGHKIIQISKGSIITPLAKDYIKTNNMSLFKE